MEAAVVYEKEYILYGQEMPRSIDCVMVQHEFEDKSEFLKRVNTYTKTLNSTHSYYDYNFTLVQE